MDFGNPWSLLSGGLISLVGMAVFIYGKKQCDLKCLAAGAVLCVVPCFVSSAWVLWVVAAGCMGALYLTAEPG